MITANTVTASFRIQGSPRGNRGDIGEAVVDLDATEEGDMPHTIIEDLTHDVAVQPGSVVSKVVHKGDGLDVTMFAFDVGEGLTEHTARRPAIVQVLSGRLSFTVEDDETDARAGAWIHMTADTPHSLEALQPTLMLLTLLPKAD
jgi:quercetin dioxygenase-like cupin family protein